MADFREASQPSRHTAIERGVGAVLAASAAVALPARPARAATLVPLHIASALSESSANSYYAHELGFFKQQGLDTTIELFASSGAFSSALISGSFDVGGVDTGALVTAHVRGVPFALLANGGSYNAEAPNTMLCTAKDSPIRSAADFEKQTIAVTALNGTNHIALLAWLEKGGANYHAVNIIEVPSSAMPTAVTSGRIAAALIGEPYLTESAEVIRPIAGVGSAIARQFMLAAWSSSRSWLEGNRDTARKFVAAMNQASAWAITHKKDADAIFARYVKLPLPMAQRIHHVSWSTAPAVELLQPVVDAFAKYGLIPKSYPATELL
jgi:NitT/TauT family transport system substrate-binding protein